jgi:site-specific DNA-methyltransferase (adenine-specific)
MRREAIGSCEMTCEDCMELMARYPDKHFDLAIVDPPFGIGESWRKDPRSPFYAHTSSYKNSGKVSGDYFSELFRVAEHIIFWGANYYANQLEERNSWIVWDKAPLGGRLFNSDCELAWTSFNRNMKIVRLVWDGFNTCEPRYNKHPHEKPVMLYKWLLANYAKPGWKILDTHLGSGSHAIACHDMGFPLVACEIDEFYFDTAVERLRLFCSQGTLEFA